MITRDAWATPSLADRGSVVLRTLGTVFSKTTEESTNTRAATLDDNDTVGSGSITGPT
jgi:hypothetical protein